MSRSPSPDIHLPSGVTKISEKDYFLKSDEFRVWLREEKGKYFDELSGERARSYFRKFVKAWNRGRLSSSLYTGVQPGSRAASSSTGYKWSFASNHSRVDQNALQEARESVSAATHGPSSRNTDSMPSKKTIGPSLPPPGRVLGPSLPSSSDRQLLREEEEERATREKAAGRKRERAEDRERIEEIVGPREMGREGMLEKKRMRRENDRQFRERSPGGEISEDVLMGEDSFQARIAQRDAARKRTESKRQSIREEREMAARERTAAMREKDKATMEMFKALAKERFG